MKRPKNTSDDSARVGILHFAGGQWYALAADLTDRLPEVLAVREFANSEAGEIDQWLDEHEIAQVLCVLPASTYICRTCTLPDVPPDALGQALELQVEAHLPDVVPDYRLAAAALDPATGETNRTGILIAWPESAQFETPVSHERIRYVPDIAALAALMNGERPADPLVIADPQCGSIAIALTHTNGAAFRAAKDAGDSVESWQESVGRVLAETALAANHSGPFIESIVDMARTAVAEAGAGQPAFLLPAESCDSARRRVHGASLEAAWWRKYGVALGALLAYAGDLHGLTQLELAPPVESPSRLDGLLTAMARPRTAVMCAIICLLLLAFGPLALHGTRLALLKLRYGDLNTRMAAYDHLMAKREMYDDLRREAWPMTKLLADLSTNTPPGIELDSISFSHGDSFMASGLAIPFTYPDEQARDDDKWSQDYPVGKLEALENIAIMQQNLSASNVFNNPTFTTRQPNAFGHYEFIIQADIAQPYHDRHYPVDWDYGKWTMLQRIDGVGPGEEKYPASGATADTSLASSVAVDTAESTSRPTSFPSGAVPAEAEEDIIGADGAIAAVPNSRTQPPRNNSTRLSRPGLSGRTGADDDAGSFSNQSERSAAGVGPAFEVPEPFTQDQVNSMDRDQVLAALSKVSGARTAVRGKDDALEEQLDAQFSMLMTRLREIGQVR